MSMTSKRLTTIAEMVTPCGVAADIGCDHCLTLMSLLKNGVCEKAIGSDIGQGPLEKARENIIKHGCGAKIELRRGSGLSTIAEGEAEALIISGMGGGLINEILQDGYAVAKSASQLIIQPQNDVCRVREYIHASGFRIIGEKMVLEQGKYYNIIKASPGEEKYEKETYYLYGKVLIHNKDVILGRYLRSKLAENEKIKGNLSGGSGNCQLRMAELQKENSIIREVLKWLQE